MATARRQKATEPRVQEISCPDWSALLEGLAYANKHLDIQSGEFLWFRGSVDSKHTLAPSLMRYTDGLNRDNHDRVEQELFFGFQARAAELRARGLTDWEYLFYSRHYDVPTRVLDWTDTFGVALYFAVESFVGKKLANSEQFAGAAASSADAPFPAIWAMNPYALNEKTLKFRDIILPKYLGLIGDDFWDFGELVAEDGENWSWDGPAAIYPAQIHDRVRAQRGWFTIHGNNRDPIDVQKPVSLFKLVLQPQCVAESLHLLKLFGLHRYSIYPDLDNLAKWIRLENSELVESLRSQEHGTSRNRGRKTKRSTLKKPSR